MDKRQIWGGGGGAISKLANVFNRCQVGKRRGNGGGGGGGGGGRGGGGMCYLEKSILQANARTKKIL